MSKTIDDIVFVGDEVTASGFRLAGIRVVVAEPRDTLQLLDELTDGSASLVLLAAPNANAMALEELSRRIRTAAPPIMVVADAAGRSAMPDFAYVLKRRLGVAA